mgnify:CR=1 FL=1
MDDRNDYPVCVITGAGPGNGQALARRFVAGGYRVALIARRAGPLQALADDIEGAAAYPVDVGDEQGVNETFARIAAELGPIQTLLYNAGGAVFGDAETITTEDFAVGWRSNALGLLHCARAVIPGMRALGSGQIIVSGATASKKGGANFAGFASAKAAQHSLAQSLARQLGPEGIHVAIFIIDGVIDSEHTRELLPDWETEQFMQPEDIADSVYHVAQQPRSAWTFEIDLRPFCESW